MEHLDYDADGRHCFRELIAKPGDEQATKLVKRGPRPRIWRAELGLYIALSSTLIGGVVGSAQIHRYGNFVPFVICTVLLLVGIVLIVSQTGKRNPKRQFEQALSDGRIYEVHRRTSTIWRKYVWKKYKNKIDVEQLMQQNLGELQRLEAYAEAIDDPLITEENKKRARQEIRQSVSRACQQHMDAVAVDENTSRALANFRLDTIRSLDALPANDSDGSA